ncbi:hypothetical protein N7509_000502 [Penicillium cosmopolitanum]|uniref:ABC transporter n=1 Tax=Penicillium cosmopolitanum TaxID=1131564 RepID=A0A9W9WAE4_9EURO|nr:uncharacterized protein N7509_000502 [Penicillium cosmopolitanum]KAJ5413875.1 hypothetical protein N7509_000502 [Penicillium cosmopolitanum]
MANFSRRLNLSLGFGKWGRDDAIAPKVSARKTPQQPSGKVSYWRLYQCATTWELAVLFTSTVCAVVAGTGLPLMCIIFGSAGGSFSDYSGNPNAELQHFKNHNASLAIYLIYIAIGVFLTTYIATVGFIYCGERITARLREQYLQSLLRQEMVYFDIVGAGLIATCISTYANLVQDGMSHKVSLALTAVSTFVSAYVIGLVKYWKLAVICLSSAVAVTITVVVSSHFVVKYFKRAYASYGNGGNVVEEAISTIRNAIAFGTSEKLAELYCTHLKKSEEAGFVSKAISGSLFGGLMCYAYLTYALAFWLGTRWLSEGELSYAAFITVLQAVMIGAFALSGAAPSLQAIASAIAAAGPIYQTIDRQSALDSQSEDGIVLESVDGNIEFRDIKHIYPSRPDTVVFSDFNLRIPSGKTTAIVGPSGAGKSTLIALLERFYDPTGGAVLLDGRDVRKFNLRWLRGQFGLVSQEPALFDTTIAGNIRHGLVGTLSEDLQDDEIQSLVEKAAKLVDAHDFIRHLPNGYETQVGQRGSLLSGGQKQRIALAAVMIRDPKILLLDEATSSLDNKGASVVQAALNKASLDRTTLVIAHRLSAVKHADNIAVVGEGRIVEQGTHQELMEKAGRYYSLFSAQQAVSDDLEVDQDAEKLERAVSDSRGASTELTYAKSNLTTRDISPMEIEAPSKPRSVNFFSRIKLRRSRNKPIGTSSFLTLVKTVARLNRNDWRIMLLALCSSIVTGASQPLQSVFYAKLLSIIALQLGSSSFSQSDLNLWIWMFFMLALVHLVFSILQGVSLAWCSERLISQAREQSFRAILRQDASFFDQKENSTGSLSSFLSSETANLAGISGVVLGTIIQVTVTLVAGYIVSLAIGWKLALVCISTVPILLGSGFFRVRLLARFQQNQAIVHQASTAYACEAVDLIRTIASQTRENNVADHYHTMLDSHGRQNLHAVLKASLLYAASQSLLFPCIALGLWYGSELIADREYTIFQFFLCFSAVIFGSQAAGTIFSFSPDISKAKYASAKLHRLFGLVPKIDPWNETGKRLTDLKGTIQFKGVHFAYSSRQETPILRGIDLKVEAGQLVALVGTSGSGKSTIVSLVERFYDPQEGTVYVDDQDLRTLHVATFRNHLALVSQETTLYNGTIRANLLLGTQQSDDSIPEEDIVDACKGANIYDFITSLPEGFETVVGSRGSMLSGGQRQRLAIARALIRNPKILLLDEATSNLDAESEEIVQAALEKAASGRTTILVAHRLSTVRRADFIYFLENGQIVEQGNHEALLSKKGRYYDMVHAQEFGQDMGSQPMV